jgi:hypothetical protein
LDRFQDLWQEVNQDLLSLYIELFVVITNRSL